MENLSVLKLLKLLLNSFGCMREAKDFKDVPATTQHLSTSLMIASVQDTLEMSNKCHPLGKVVPGETQGPRVTTFTSSCKPLFQPI